MFVRHGENKSNTANARITQCMHLRRYKVVKSKICVVRIRISYGQHDISKYTHLGALRKSRNENHFLVVDDRNKKCLLTASLLVWQHFSDFFFLITSDLSGIRCMSGVEA